MNGAASKFTHVLITRPREDAEQLAGMLANMGIQSIIQPAQEFLPRSLESEERSALAEPDAGALLVFTSPRAVEFGLRQLPPQVLDRTTIAAIGPATTRALAAAGRKVSLQPEAGYTSESLLEVLEKHPRREGADALLVCAPGGRDLLAERLAEQGWNVRPLWVYERRPAKIRQEAIAAIEGAERLLTVFTSAEAMNALSQRLRPATWFAVCSGDWLVISGRLRRLARAFGPADVHLAAGPRNADLATAIRSIA